MVIDRHATYGVMLWVTLSLGLALLIHSISWTQQPSVLITLCYTHTAVPTGQTHTCSLNLTQAPLHLQCLDSFCRAHSLHEWRMQSVFASSTEPEPQGLEVQTYTAWANKNKILALEVVAAILWPTHCSVLLEKCAEHMCLDENKPLSCVCLFLHWGFHLLLLVLKGCGQQASWVCGDNCTLPLWRANNSLMIKSLMTHCGFLW